MAKISGCSGAGLPRPGYRKTLDFFEVKDTFLLPPKSKTLERWREISGEEFVFAVKAWQVITHESDSPGYQVMPEGIRSAMQKGGHFKEGGEIREAWEQTLRAAKALRARVILFETPASFTPTSRNRARISSFFESIERLDDILLVWEPLGIWSSEERLTICGDLGLISAGDEESLQSTDVGYVRLHRGTYDEDRLIAIADATWESEEMYYAFQGPEMVHHARRLQKLLSETGG
ncbi:MAG: DUF72 domain-containing protein [Deltaproteobacteria bacterium]|nr:DUF72 domain-containing protein [Deltaproteobacteria bacterium]